MTDHITRRSFVKGTLGVSASLMFSCGDVAQPEMVQGSEEEPGEQADVGVDAFILEDTDDTDRPEGVDVVCDDPFEGGLLEAQVGFHLEGRQEPIYHKLLGEGHDARLVTDLSVIEPGVASIPADDFFIRTGYPDLLTWRPDEPWSIAITGLVESDSTIQLSDLEPGVVPQGTYVLECSGNSVNRHFGLMSAGAWSGVKLTGILEGLPLLREATGVLIEGFDEHSTTSAGGHSVPGASWVFTFEQLEGAFLATHLNGEPLTREHGAPVRLYVPNWYGCCAIKWVNSIRVVGPDEPATAQMIEFASRTHQPSARPEQLANAFRAATMDQSAMPVRVERWSVDGESLYRVVGILWGGATPVSALSMRFEPAGQWFPVKICPAQADNDGWTVWSIPWSPSGPGTYTLRCRVDAPEVPTLRLSEGYYDRVVRLEQV